jgi:hypothetical protein
VGWFAYGKVIADGCGQVGIVQFTDENGIPLRPDDNRVLVPQTIIIADANVTQTIADDMVADDSANKRKQVGIVQFTDENGGIPLRPDDDRVLVPQTIIIADANVTQTIADDMVADDSANKRKQVVDDWYASSSVNNTNVVSGKRCHRNPK